ncbi:hypothetical protein SCOR_02515 [Sulfidibacter corallicola]|uniref:Uncharacterized protein n=1 Tax=Sulfidibacter corallicola TaxID=2818388 RepID=A0A8A4TGB9_SULCO|nr:hypothetical protein [Sulfidibacter corallicola]QTD48600.1 hypothetical protein J3U87_23720 [Sulfidibacter corallicola]
MTVKFATTGTVAWKGDLKTDKNKAPYISVLIKTDARGGAQSLDCFVGFRGNLAEAIETEIEEGDTIKVVGTLGQSKRIKGAKGKEDRPERIYFNGAQFKLEAHNEVNVFDELAAAV